jgi:DNA polymerase I-like protein with 3'-5' exonuclease and polymerase domains
MRFNRCALLEVAGSAEEAEALSKRFSEMMEKAATLRVPLTTSIKIGERWSALK